MIPKIIHYCWFGYGEKSELVNRCVASWKRNLPDYQIIEWNENNFDVNICQFTKEAYEHKKWAFVSDYARLYALNKYGGIYFDTDVEVLKPFDQFLHNRFFSGYESKEFPTTAVIGAEKSFPLLTQLMDYYNGKPFCKPDGTFETEPNPYVWANILHNNGFVLNGRMKNSNGIQMYPQSYFSPNSFGMMFGNIPNESYAIHHFEQSWRTVDKRTYDTIKKRVRRYCVGLLKNTIGIKNTLKLREIMNAK